MPSRERTLRLVPVDQPPTSLEVAQVQIRALKVLRGLSETERLEKGAAIVDDLRSWAIIAAGIVGARETIVPHVQKYFDEYSGNILNQLTKATHKAKTLVDIIHAAECRVAAAVATIEADRVRR